MACMQKSLYRKERRKKKELDKLSLDMIQCEKDGYGCHYGAWKATQEHQTEFKRKEYEPRFGWCICKYCGKRFPKEHGKQLYCDSLCQRSFQTEKYREGKREYAKKYMQEKRAEERNMENESNA